MTTGKSKNKLVRDIQRRTDWSYVRALRLVTVLGYKRVSEAIDRNDDDPHGHPEALGERLLEEARVRETGQ